MSEPPKPFKVSISDGEAIIPAFTINENAKDPWFDARVFGLDTSGKVVAYGALRIPLVSRQYESTLFLSAAEDFVRLTKLDEPSSDNLMPQSLVGHQAIALKDGRLAIIGGTTQISESKGLIGIPIYKNMVRNIILYDPATGIFETGPALGNPRAFHTATLLPDGRVLIAGGIGYFNSTVNGQSSWNLSAIRTVEIYDPTDDSVVLGGGHMEVARAFHSATLLSDGAVLFVGGLTKPILTDVAGERVGHQVTELEVYRADTRTGGQVVGKLDLEQSRFLHRAVSLRENEVLVAGGMSIDKDGDRVVQSAGLLLTRQSSGNWDVKVLGDPSTTARYDHSLVRVQIGDSVWAVAIGGRGNDHKAVGQIDIWDGSGKLTSGSSLKIARYGAAAVIMANQKLVVAGGVAETEQPVMEGEVYELQDNGGTLSLQIQNISPKLRSEKGRYRVTALSTSFDSRVYFIGGAIYQGAYPGGPGQDLFQGINTVEIYTPVLSLPAGGNE